MRNRELSKLVSVAGSILPAFLFVFSQSAWAGQDPKTKDAPKPEQKAAVQQTSEKPSSAAMAEKAQPEEGQPESSERSSAEEKSARGGRHEGIKVHGHWTIEVHNPDGSLVRHVEFDNTAGDAGLTGRYRGAASRVSIPASKWHYLAHRKPATPVN
jgi:hypothetical protein